MPGAWRCYAPTVCQVLGQSVSQTVTPPPTHPTVTPQSPPHSQSPTPLPCVPSLRTSQHSRTLGTLLRRCVLRGCCCRCLRLFVRLFVCAFVRSFVCLFVQGGRRVGGRECHCCCCCCCCCCWVGGRGTDTADAAFDEVLPPCF